MNDASSPVESYGILAEACLAHPAWPASLQPKPRSLAALFSKLDRNIELEWLADREGVQHVLVSLLGCPLQRIRDALEEARIEHDEGRPVYRFASAPRARPLELVREPLPPSFPELLSAPRRWRRHFWAAGPSDGTALVAAWLQARGLANPVFAKTPEEAVQRLDPTCANFVVLERWEEPPVWPNAWLCVAVRAECPGGFEPVPLLEREQGLDASLRWLAERLPPDGRLDPVFTRDWLLQHPALVPDFESTISLIALIDELGSRAVEGESALGLAQAFVARRIADAQAPAEGVHWVRDNALTVLVGLARACATQSAAPFSAARTRDEWVDLVPDEFRRGLDVSWAKASLARAGAPISQELDRALAKAPPGAFRAISDLERAGLFASEDGQTLRPVPAWLVRVVESQAVQQVAASSVDEWGEAVALGHAEAALHGLLVQRLHDGDEELIDQVLDLEDPSSLTSVAAVEALTRAFGEALLGGAELDPALSTAFLGLQGTWLVRLADGTVVPRIGARDPVRHGAFLLGLWALEQAAESDGEKSTLLDEPPPAAASAMLDVALRFLEGRSGAPWVYAGYGLLGRLARQRAPLHPCAIPLLVVRDPRWSVLGKLSRLAHGVAAVRHLCGGDEEWSRLAADMWRSWLAAGLPDTDLFTTPALWPHAPLDVLRALAQRDHPVLATARMSSLSEAQWTVLLDASSQTSWVPWPLLSGSLAAPGVALALRSADRPALSALWLSSAETLLRALEGALARAPAKDLELLLEAVPSERSESALRVLEAAVSARGVAHPAIELIRGWLLERCSRRGPECRAAYALLDDIERRFVRVRQARGVR